MAAQQIRGAPPKAKFSVRNGRAADILFLEHVERSAAKLFSTVGLGSLAEGPTVDPTLLNSMTLSNHLWVAVNSMDEPVGFLGGQNLEGNFHILEISVAEEFQRMGVGKALIAVMVEDIQKEGYKAITLTTNKEVPWNGPWYQKMGFFEVNAEEMGRKYEEILEEEARHGHDPSKRCVMSRMLS